MIRFAQAVRPVRRTYPLFLRRQKQLLPYALALLAAALTGVLLAFPSGYLMLLPLAAAGWLLAWSLRWRAALVALFLFLPIAAVPGILLQQQGWPTLLKDGLFLLPGYVGFTMTLMKRQTFRWPLPASLTMLLAGLISVVTLQALRVIPSSPLVALIGIRSWIIYLPLVLVPAAVFTSVAEVQRVIRLLVLVSLIPAVVGLVEFVFIVSGHVDLAYQWYGGLGSEVSQGFAQVGVSDQLLVYRVPSTFTFVTQFVAYCLVTTPLCLVVWMSDPDARWRRVAAVASVAIIAAGFCSGSRTFYVWGPIEVGLVLLLMKRGRVQLATIIVIAGAAAVVALGSHTVEIATFITGLGWDYLVKTQAAEFLTVYQATGFLGGGAGIDTNGSRYVLPSGTLPFGIEGWYALAFLELGLPGLILILLLWSVLIRHAWAGMRLTRGSAAFPIAVGTFVILLSTIVTLYKGASLEYDPLNVYFWAVAGLALALPRLVTRADGLQVNAPALGGAIDLSRGSLIRGPRSNARETQQI